MSLLGVYSPLDYPESPFPFAMGSSTLECLTLGLYYPIIWKYRDVQGFFQLKLLFILKNHKRAVEVFCRPNPSLALQSMSFSECTHSWQNPIAALNVYYIHTGWCGNTNWEKASFLNTIWELLYSKIGFLLFAQFSHIYIDLDGAEAEVARILISDSELIQLHVAYTLRLM